MTQTERRIYLIKELLSEEPRCSDIKLPSDEQQQKNLLRSLLNIRMPHSVSEEFLQIQDAYLQEETKQKGITDFNDLSPVQEGLYIWRGDITTLRCDAIVNAANSQMLGCFYPCHGCIDNQIHTFSGVQLRAACAQIMKSQGRQEKTGSAKITPAFNLPCKYVLHTVGPIVNGSVTKKGREQLASCYRSCLELAHQNGIKSLAFCCISTGEFHFPQELAAQTAVKTVKEYREQINGNIEVIFNVFKESDFNIYKKLLGADSKAEK